MTQPEAIPATTNIPPNQYVQHMSLMVLLDLVKRGQIKDYGISEPGKDHRRLVYYVRDGIHYHGYVQDNPQNTHMVSNIDHAWESAALPVQAAS